MCCQNRENLIGGILSENEEDLYHILFSLGLRTELDITLLLKFGHMMIRFDVCIARSIGQRIKINSQSLWLMLVIFALHVLKICRYINYLPKLLTETP